MEHWYGLPEALFNDRTIQDYPLDYNYQNEQHRFEQAGKLWEQAAKPYSEHWNRVMEELLANTTNASTESMQEVGTNMQTELVGLHCRKRIVEAHLASIADGAADVSGRAPLGAARVGIGVRQTLAELRP